MPDKAQSIKEKAITHAEVFFYGTINHVIVAIGKPLMRSPAFPLLRTGRASFPASGAPSNRIY
jgi:hypothetical protein